MTGRRATGVLPVAALVAVVIALALGGCVGDEDEERAGPPPRTGPGPPPGDGDSKPPPRRPRPLARAEGGPRVETLVTGLDTPWDLAFLPDGRALVTERPGRVRLLSREGELRREPVAEVDVAAVGEGGLLGIAVDPGFARNRFVYLYRTTVSGNEVLRFRMRGERLEQQARVVRRIRAGVLHDGGRIRFGPDRRLYIGTGEAGDPSLAQDRRSLNGKMLRIGLRALRGRGGRPEVFTLGHRNSQGFDWEPGRGRLIASEHGPEGNDEVNVLRRGRNYGWPRVQGRGSARGLTSPVNVYDDSIAPSGADFVSLPGSAWTGDLLIAALVGEQIRRVRLDGDLVVVDEPLFEGDFGRLRTVVEGPDGALYALTSNRDGRGTPRGGDDRVLRIVPPAG